MITPVTRTSAGIASEGAKCLAQRIDGRSLSETGDETAVVFHREVHIAVGTPECSESRHRAACSAVSPVTLATPATQPVSLMLWALLPKTPPSVPRLRTE